MCNRWFRSLRCAPEHLLLMEADIELPPDDEESA
jgi:hypothetical protein